MNDYASTHELITLASASVEVTGSRGYKPETAESFCKDWLLVVTQTFVCVTSKIWSEIAEKQSHYPSPRQCDVNGFPFLSRFNA